VGAADVMASRPCENGAVGTVSDEGPTVEPVETESETETESEPESESEPDAEQQPGTPVGQSSVGSILTLAVPVPVCPAWSLIFTVMFSGFPRNRR
jgi:hypothetical protein